jgi:hypothetical protein
MGNATTTDRTDEEIEQDRINAERDAERRAARLNSLGQFLLWMRNNPDVELPYWLDFDLWASDDADMARRIRSMGGAEKVYDSSSMRAIKDFGNGVRYRVSISREEVCTKVLTGYETRKTTKYVPVETEETVETFEWECKPIMAALDSED